MSKSFQFDVFISHCSKDKPVVRELAERLKRDGLRVWFDEWVMQPGDMIGLKIEEGLELSRTLILVMSANAFASEWVKLERHTALFRDPTNAERRFIPIRLDNAKIKDTLKQFLYVDWREKSQWDEQYKKLLAVCRKDKKDIVIPAVKKEHEVKKKPKVKEPMVLEGHSDSVLEVTITPDGKKVVSCSDDETLKVWDLQSGQCLDTFLGHGDAVNSVAITPDGKKIVSGSFDKTLKVWDLHSGQCLDTLKGHNSWIAAVAITPDSRKTVSYAKDETLKVWDLESGKILLSINVGGEAYNHFQIAITPDSEKVIASKGWNRKSIGVWNLESGEILLVLESHTKSVNCVAITPDGKKVVSSSEDNTLKLWNLESGQCLATFEGHTKGVNGIAITPDGKKVVSGSDDKTLKVWDLESGQCLVTFEGHSDSVYGVAVTPDGKRVVSASGDNTVRVWEMPEHLVATDSTRYTNAKVLLVGDSGVGKSGLALRLTENKFEPTISTDAAWATQMELKHQTNTADIEREIWLWDFGGQADYRLIHQLFMDETALAVLVFNPQSDNPFEGLGQWDRDLQRAARRKYQKLLVAGRCDRGGMTVSGQNIEDFRKERGFAGFMETSALTGDGCAELHQAIVENIPWDQIPWTASPQIFKLLKEAIIKLKDEGKALLRISELRQQLEMRLSEKSFTMEDLRAVVGLLVGPGAVWQLEFGDFVLLQPERVNAYASAVIRSVRAHKEEIGCIAEQRVLDGDLDYQDMKRLPYDEEQIVLRAMHQTLVDHGLCLREHTEEGSLLVFPSYFKRERPEMGDHPNIFVTYRFSGPLNEIYATLIVKLIHTAAFDKDRLWRYAADFKSQGEKRLGLKMTKKAEGSAEITVYFEPDVQEETRVTFIRYIHDHLKNKDPNMIRLRHYVCPDCSEPVESRRAIEKRLEMGHKNIFCGFCGSSITLIDLIEKKFESKKYQRRSQDMDQQARTSIAKESNELILINHAFATAKEAGQIFRQYKDSDHGIDAEIEFTDEKGKADRNRIYLLLKSGDSYTHTQKSDGKEIITIEEPENAQYWLNQAYPVMLVIRTSDGKILWMDIKDYLRRCGESTMQITFDGNPFTALNLSRLRDRLSR